ncbi:hypothetical protein [Blastochloris sulfoviridis]|uniref:DUF4189 domain-containing protein n=1 Tax=Blastochloris sulfoviridis TaxID=50712 RepID=A0A5M6HTF5_9HYPH|nr:hypothetical protein [Blastochloris sulfoviridis]KAA5599204.1 hypothetical protein F1193_12775 [Blastochloris sulfoviridis]
MRFPRPLLSAIAALGLSVTHAAAVETETFVISNFDGYGVDQCLAEGRPCGQAAAAAWCHSRDYQTVVDFGRLDRTNSTSARPTAQPAQGTQVAANCTGRACGELIAIICAR